MRPRERLVARGASSLSDDELVALVIGSGTKKSSALVRANELLRRVGGMRALGQADAIRLRAIGVSDVASIRLVAACEVGRRVAIAGTAGGRRDTPEPPAPAPAPPCRPPARRQPG